MALAQSDTRTPSVSAVTFSASSALDLLPRGSGRAEFRLFQARNPFRQPFRSSGEGSAALARVFCVPRRFSVCTILTSYHTYDTNQPSASAGTEKGERQGKRTRSQKPEAECRIDPCACGELGPSYEDRRSGRHVGDADTVLAHGQTSDRERSVADNGPPNECPGTLCVHRYGLSFTIG